MFQISNLVNSRSAICSGVTFFKTKRGLTGRKTRMHQEGINMAQGDNSKVDHTFFLSLNVHF